MVPVIGDLGEHHPVFRVHPHHPVQSPAGLVKNVRHSVGSRFSVCLISVRENALVLNPLPGEHHMVSSRCAGSLILKVIRRIVPASANIYPLSVPLRMVHDVAVQLMAESVRERVVAALLLPHVIEQNVGRSVIHVRPYLEDRRISSLESYVISARFLES